MRPIDADDLKKDYYRELNIEPGETGARFMSFGMLPRLIDNARTINVEPVRRGRWIKMSDADGIYWACSECGEDLPRISHYNPQFDLFPRLESINKTNYCPACGAKMDEVSHDRV